MSESPIKRLLVNIRALFSTNIRKRLNENSSRILELESTIGNLDTIITNRYHYLNLIDYYANHPAEGEKYQKELDFLQQTGQYRNFPYPNTTEDSKVHAEYDKVAGLPYVSHRGKPLYFPATLSAQEVADKYRYLVGEERLLGLGDDQEAPHQYQSQTVHVDEGDTLLDIGAAEGLFALDNIEKASHVVIVEQDPTWAKPLQHTFAPYGDKVTILQRFVSSVDTETTLSLAKLLADLGDQPTFVKMDIEGYELPSLVAAAPVMKEKTAIKMAVAAYHRQHDFDEMYNLFAGLGYTIESSSGYMLFSLYDTPTPPYFRKGIIRAKS